MTTSPFEPNGTNPFAPQGVPLPQLSSTFDPQQSLSSDPMGGIPDQSNMGPMGEDAKGLVSKLTNFFSPENFQRLLFIVIGIVMLILGVWMLGSNIGGLAIAQALKKP